MDLKQLFDATTRGEHSTERRLMVDILAARQAYRRFEIEGVALIKVDVNLADALSKIKDNNSVYKIIANRIDPTPVQQ